MADRAGLGARKRESLVWADRLRALAAIKRLRPEFAGIQLDELLPDSRRELDERIPRC
jgi:hypothetical protein